MAYVLGNCPKCGARLLIEDSQGNDYDEIDVDCATVNLTFVVRCWKCGSVVKSIIASNIEEVPMEVKLMKRNIPMFVIHTKNLEELVEKNIVEYLVFKEVDFTDG